MSSSNPSFVNDLVEMAKAFEALPRVQADLADTQRQLSTAQDTIAARETSILSLRQTIEAQQAQLRKVEAERDDALSAFLEADDRVSAFKRLVAGFSSDAAALVKAAEPEVKPDTPFAGEAITSGDNGPQFVTTGIAGNVDSQTVAVPSESMPQSWRDDLALGQSATDPTEDHAAPIGIGTANEVSGSESEAPTPLPPSIAPSKEPASEDGSATLTASSSADAGSPTSEVGYENEPTQFTSAGFVTYEWCEWARRMDIRYGVLNWPSRPDATN